MMPTTNPSPWELLFKTKPDNNILKVFGCSYYPLMSPYNHPKFELRSLLYIFLGYSPKHKAIKCFHTPTGRLYISRNVKFDEHVFPFEQADSITSSPQVWQISKPTNEIPLVPLHASSSTLAAPTSITLAESCPLPGSRDTDLAAPQIEIGLGT
ncbi:hypothetical protein NE237_019666 [Protea cynaroides]|uniref:Retroviral polymerase SH3-like domain-containing protein n=1 Tax=Protea cynaroides TaxID=273540 RepID=A0A9Q0H6Z6_9MAGN|nr:hypothetical protein NE237_019666 [Protea cynaroides]